MPDWYYAQNDEQIGPVSAAALKEMAQQGKLGRDDLIWREGMERWAPAHKVRGLFPEGSDEAAPSENGEVNKSPDEDDDASPPEEAETAIDALPLAGPEESKLHVPTLGRPEASPENDREESNELVVFEPAQTPPPRPAGRVAPATPESDSRPDSSGSGESPRQTRVDVPQATRGSLAAGVALFLQTFTWVSCLLVILIGGAVYVWTLVMTADPSDRLAASAVYAALVVASYFLARSTERICRVLGQWFGVTDDAKTRRTMRERNWSRFQ